MSEDREFDIPVSGTVRIHVELFGRRIDRYAVLLLVWIDGRWETVRVHDNHLGSHHMHRYTRRGGKEEPEEFHPGPTNQALPAAVAHLRAHHEPIIQSWLN